MTTRVSNVENFFWVNPSRESNWFNEAPQTVVEIGIENTSSIDTSDIDGYRQGVEITTIKHFDAGTIKIHAGEPGHVVRQTTIGLNHVYHTSRAFKDGGGVDPTQFIGSTSSISRQVTAQPFISVPPPTELSSLEFEKYLYDGVIDFLGARRRDVMLRTITPTDTRGVRGEIQDGNIDEAGGTNQIVTIYEWNPRTCRERPFFDDPLLLDRRWSSAPFTGSVLTGSKVSPFDDILPDHIATGSTITNLIYQPTTASTIMYHPLNSSYDEQVGLWDSTSTSLSATTGTITFDYFPGLSSSRGVKFDGNSMLRTVGTLGSSIITALTESITVEGVIYLPNPSQAQYVFKLGGDGGALGSRYIGLLFTTGSKFSWAHQWNVTGNFVQHTFTSASLLQSQSFYFAITRNGSNGSFKLYINGTLQETSPSYSLPYIVGPDYNARLLVGSALSSSRSTTPFTGTMIGGLAFHNAELSADTILSRYQSIFLSGSTTRDLKFYLSLSSSRPDNTLLSDKEKYATSGWDYDNNNAIGTDSIAFGGLTY